MNILVFTPVYYIQGRPELFHDTDCVHYLVRPWAKDHNVIVIDIYFESLRKIGRYLKKEDRKLRNGYSYIVDGVTVGLIEAVKPFKQGVRLTRHESQRVKRYIEEFTEAHNFFPDLIITHAPIATINAVHSVFRGVPRIAILHTTDRRFWSRNKKETELVRKEFAAYFCRSRELRDFFSEQKLDNLQDEIMYSGGKKANIVVPKDKGRFGIMYAGKLIPQKHVEVIISALAMLQNEFEFFFEIYGDGPERESLERLAKEKLKGSLYEFKGHVDREEILSAMTYNDYFVMVSENECFGVTYVEAMVNGCVPIGSKGEGIDGIIVDGVNGFLVKANNVLALKEKLKQCFLASDSEKEDILNRMEMYSNYYSEMSAGRHYIELITRTYMEHVQRKTR